MTVNLVADLESPYPADVFLFHPTEHRIFIVGTYLLVEETKARHGKLCVYELHDSQAVANGDRTRLLQEIDCDAILDLKFYQDLLYVAHSTGSISTFKTSGQHEGSVRSFMEMVQCKYILDPSVLIMSLSVAARGILTANSDGTVAILSHDLQLVSLFRVSDLEVWIQSWSTDQHVIYSGSDDGLFAAWDVRQPNNDEQRSAIFENRKSHGAGVTAIKPGQDGSIVLTGSYDDHIRRFDMRNPRKSILEKNLGGGVWRIISKSDRELVTCCMYNGARVIDEDTFEILKEWTGHASIVYGGDCSDDTIGTCSFYDKRVCIWN